MKGQGWTHTPPKVRAVPNNGGARTSANRPAAPATVTSRAMPPMDPLVLRALFGDGESLNKRRQRKWKSFLIKLDILEVVPGSSPPICRMGINKDKLERYLPYRKKIADE